MEVRDIVEKMLKSEDVSEFVTPENVSEIEFVLESMQKNMAGVPDSQSMGIGTEMIKFDKCGQWKIEKAKVEENAHPKMKQRIRAERKKSNPDKLDAKEQAVGGDSDTASYDDGGTKWRKPKSGEKGHKFSPETTKEIKGWAGDKALPKAGKAAMVTSGVSEQGIDQRNEKWFKDNAHKAEDFVKFDDMGQWSIEKANTLDYKKINPKPDYKSMEDKAPKLDYSKMEAPKPQPKPWAGAAERAANVKAGIKTGQTAMETIQERGQGTPQPPHS